MQHCEPDVLALRALGETAGTAADDDHLRSCRRCRDELDQLRSVVATGRSITPADSPHAPPPHVWQRISAELAIDGSPPSTARPAQGPGPSGRVIPFRQRYRTWLIAAAAGLVGIALGALGTVALTVLDGPADSSGQVVATAQLGPLPTRPLPVVGNAAVDDTPNGQVLTVSVRGLPQESGFYEVWLLDRDAERLVSLGVLDNDHSGSFPLPPGLDLSDYAVVDISLEPVDGNPAHSMDSVSRGTLTA